MFLHSKLFILRLHLYVVIFHMNITLFLVIEFDAVFSNLYLTNGCIVKKLLKKALSTYRTYQG